MAQQNLDPMPTNGPEAPSPYEQSAPAAPLTHEECMKKIAHSFQEKGMEKDEIDMQMGLVEKTAKQFQSTDPLDVILKHMEDPSFKREPQETIDKFKAVKFDLVPTALSENASVSPSGPLQQLDEAGKSADVDRGTQKVINLQKAVDIDIDTQKALDIAQAKAAQNAHDQQQQTNTNDREPLTAGAALLRGIGNLVNKASNALSGDPTRMNMENLDPEFLANKSMDRLSNAAGNLSLMKPGAPAEDIAKAKSDVLEAAGDAQRYMSNENRSHIAQMGEGKKNEFDASDKTSDRSKSFHEALDKAGGAKVAEGDNDFQKELKTSAEKAMEMVKQMLESFKEMASKLFNVGASNDNDSKPAGAKPSGPR